LIFHIQKFVQHMQMYINIKYILHTNENKVREKKFLPI
jgi:hypothetical protein